MLLGIKLSGEHPTLPRSECLACLDALGMRYKLILDWERYLGLDVDGSKIPELGARLGLAHELHQVLSIVSSFRELLREISKLDFPSGARFAVRVESMGRKLDHLKFARRLGDLIRSKGLKVDLENPQIIYKLLGHPRGIIFCIKMLQIPKAKFSQRLPKHRPFNPPGSMHPKLARALVNLSCIPPGGRFLDPFCGTGGFLIEAESIGAIPIGGDLSPKMLLGSKLNMEFLGMEAQLALWDALWLPIKSNSIDGIATDLPYGRSHALRSGFDHAQVLDELLRVLRPGAKAVVVTHFPLKHPNMIQAHIQRVHRSLSRYISVISK